MSDPHLNNFCAIGQMLNDGVMDYIGPSNAVPRCRFTLVQARPHILERKSRGYETVLLPCEIYGRYAETFARTAGADSWLTVVGRARSYNQERKHPDIWFVIQHWTIIGEAILPNRGFDRHHEGPGLNDITGLPKSGDEDET